MEYSRVNEVVSDLQEAELNGTDFIDYLGGDLVYVGPQLFHSPFYHSPDECSMIREDPVVRLPSILPPSRFYMELVGLNPARPPRPKRVVAPPPQVETAGEESLEAKVIRLVSPKRSPFAAGLDSTGKKNTSLRHAGTRRKMVIITAGTLHSSPMHDKGTPKHHHLTEEQIEKYFGEGAKDDFFALYRQMHDDRNHFTKDQAARFTKLRHQIVKHRMEVHERRQKEKEQQLIGLPQVDNNDAFRSNEPGPHISPSKAVTETSTASSTTNQSHTATTTSTTSCIGSSSGQDSSTFEIACASTSEDQVVRKRLLTAPSPLAANFRPSPLNAGCSVEGQSPAFISRSGSLSYDEEDEDLFELLENTQDEEGSESSPREEYIQCTLDSQRLPISGELLRRQVDGIFDISHKGIGDDYAILLSKALGTLPAIRHLNVSDNRLTDTSLKELLRSVNHMKDLRTLNLAYNTLNEGSSEMLRSYLSSGEASITTLILSKADIDDEECDAFVKSISTNHNLTSVDLSHNFIGNMEVKNTVQPDFNTGAEAIAELLLTEGCHLRALDLSWNHIRAGSAMALVESLSVNVNLTSLNLEYNNLGATGGNTLAKALYHNGTLRRLNICNNQITPRPAYAIAFALRKRQQLEYLNILENPIGYAGGRAFMGLVLDYGDSIEIKMGSCNFQMKDQSAWFEADKPDGLFHLDFEDAYDRSVMEDLLHMCANNDAVKIQRLKHILGKESWLIDLEVAWDDHVESHIKTHLVNEMDLHDIFRKYSHKKERLRAHGLTKALEFLGLGPYTDTRIEEFIAYYDIDGTTSIDFVEFYELIEYEVRVAEETRPRGCYMKECGSTGVWEVPSRGKASVRIVFCPVIAKAGHVTIDRQVQNFLRICPDFTNGNDAIRLSRTYLTLHPDQAQGIYDDILKLTGNKVEAVVSLLAQTHDPKSARRIINSNLPGWKHKDERRMVEHELGPLHGPIFGLPTGHYRLDLSKEMHRMAAMRLFLLSNEEKACRATSRPDKYDTSQHGSFSNFRNKMFKNKPIRLTSDFFLAMPMNGLLEFDYVSLLRTSEPKKRPITNRRLLYILCSLKVISEFEIVGGQTLLNRESTKMPTKTVLTGVRTALELSRLFHEPLPEDPSAVIGTFLPEPTDTDLGRPKGRPPTGGYSNTSTRTTPPTTTSGPLATTAPATSNPMMSTLRNKTPTPPQSASTPQRPTKANSNLSALSFLRNLRSLDPDQLNEYILNLRLCAKRARLKVNSDTIASALKDLVGSRWFTSHQARLILQAYPVKDMNNSRPSTSDTSSTGNGYVRGDLSRNNPGSVDLGRASTASSSNDSSSTGQGNYADVPYSMGKTDVDISPRINMAIWLHQKIIDLHRYHKVLDLFTPEEMAHIIYRVGWLNVFSPLTSDGGIQLCLERREEVVLARILVHMGKAEPGENWLCQQWRFSRLVPPIPAWTLSVNWLTEDGFGYKGYLTLYYYSGEGKNYKGCEPNIKLRLALTLVTLSDPPEDLLLTHFPELGKATVRERDAFLKKYLVESLSKEGISWKYSFVQPSM